MLHLVGKIEREMRREYDCKIPARQHRDLTCEECYDMAHGTEHAMYLCKEIRRVLPEHRDVAMQLFGFLRAIHCLIYELTFASQDELFAGWAKELKR